MGHIAKRDGWLSTHRSRFTDEFYFDAQLAESLLGRDSCLLASNLILIKVLDPMKKSC